MKNRFQIIALLLLLSFYSCEDKKIDTLAVKKEMKAREIKVIPEAKIIEKAMNLGNKITSEFIYHSESKSAEMSISNWEGAKPKRTFTLFEGENNLIGKEKMLLEAYLYNSHQGIKSESNIQDLPLEKSLLFTAPIISEGKTIGMWSITFLRKTIAQMIED